MCGIYGFIGKPTKKTKTVIRLLAIANEVRGKESSGIYLNNGMTGVTFKRAVNSTTLYNDQNVSNAIGRMCASDFLRVIGHTRNATHGVVSDANAHPFESNTTTFAHNGVIYNFDDLQREYQTSFAVDSQIIGHAIDKHGDLEAFNSKLEGWWCVPYIKRHEPNTLYISRHTSPLAMFLTQDKRGLYYSSDVAHLRDVVSVMGLRGTLMTSGDNRIYTLTSEFDKITITKTKITPKSYTKTYDASWYRSLYNFDDYDMWQTPKTTKRDMWWSSESTSVYDKKHHKKPLYDVVFDVASNEGCCECQIPLTTHAYVSNTGFVYCRLCKPKTHTRFDLV